MVFFAKQFVRLVTVLFVVALALSACARPGNLATDAAQQSVSDVPGSGDVAPDFIIPMLDGDSVQLSQLRGKPVVIYFWATWCGSCVFDLPIIDGVSQELANTGLRVLMVNVGQSTDVVQKFMDEEGFSIPVGLDGNMKIGRAYRLLGFPSTYFIDRDGAIQHVQVGPISRKAFLERVEQIQ